MGEAEEVSAMLVSPTNVSVPLIAPSVNVQTEQAARDNRVREPVTPTVQLAKSNAERKIKEDDKRRKQPSWDPAEHPRYEVGGETEAHTSHHDEPKSELERLFDLLALASYSQEQGKGYAMRFRLPKHIIDAAMTEGRMARRRVVIKYHYGHAVAPNTPSDVIAVL
ncbi:ATP-dependent Lon protease [Vibrio metoecus]|uniref:ATP-dependent Lon protease n=2 Tax=Vibrio metoecus TaxID=1481663 RepID=A0A271VTX5_VIBMT|nr:ATP-dependent Lon protease [Vibrio metoecus]PAR25445.1 ATP-dependent Lon protease [Vibrio metoecus]PAR31824.1 ATP-dependent Lon protease [Vibrio metoecus]PAR37301.1 ATP-dependent Lon protease [Vibrio metoecus]PAR42381.1 ATP-dependent Lon protease [Vibrio metoecus]